MARIKIKETEYPIINFQEQFNHNWKRDCIYITLESDYETIQNLFIDGLEWELLKTFEENKLFSNLVKEVENLSEYCKAGKIIDNRNGTFTVEMGKETEIEILEKELAARPSESSFISEIEANDAYSRGVNES